jgi:hypothetical protein
MYGFPELQITVLGERCVSFGNWYFGMLRLSYCQFAGREALVTYCRSEFPDWGHFRMSARSRHEVRLLRGACHRARIRATRGLAMSSINHTSAISRRDPPELYA